jgi:hypothetical protein
MLNDALTWIAPALRAADGFQRAPTYSHEKLGELAVATGDSTTAAQHHQAAPDHRRAARRRRPR